jgi:hypothetical protein
MATTKPATAKKEEATVAAKPNARQHLRDLFKKVGDTATKEQVFASFKAVTIQTHLTDLKNKKYCGKAGEVHIVKQADGNYKRVA